MKHISNKIKFLNHSSLIVESENKKILCDPWFSGAAFNNGWRLLYENSHDINQIDYDYIWISHEHPDHFSIPTLSLLVKEKNFLYQKTSDKKVKNWLEQKKHGVTELIDGEECDLKGIKITSFVCDGYDSAALFNFPNGDKFLNLNDSRVELGDTISKIKMNDLSNLRIISIQFSYANWAGNENDDEIPLHQLNIVIDRILKIYQAFKPEKILLFASYVFCSHEENFFWNSKCWLRYVAKILTEKGVNLVIPRPNQVIDMNNLSKNNFIEENELAIDYWEKQTQNIKVKDYSNKKITLEEINTAYRRWFDKLWSRNRLNAVSNKKNNNFCLRIKLIDKMYILKISLFKNEIALENTELFDCAVSSESLIFLFENDFARGTVIINSRIQFNYEWAHRFFIFFFIPYANNIGRFFVEDGLNSELLRSIEKTAAMMSIRQFNCKSILNFNKDIQLFDQIN